jgi:hypothetical protein
MPSQPSHKWPGYFRERTASGVLLSGYDKNIRLAIGRECVTLTGEIARANPLLESGLAWATRCVKRFQLYVIDNSAFKSVF